LALWARDPIVLASEEVVLAGMDVIRAGTGGVVDFRRALAALGERGILSVLGEGGAGVAAALWEAELIGRGVLYFGAKVAGGTGRGAFDRVFQTLGDAIDVDITGVTRLGRDLRLDWRRPERP